MAGQLEEKHATQFAWEFARDVIARMPEKGEHELTRLGYANAVRDVVAILTDIIETAD